jgi:hypothetical protein
MWDSADAGSGHLKNRDGLALSIGVLRIPHLAKNSEIPDFLYEALSVATCAAFIKESRMKLVEPTGLNRKSGIWGTL